MKKYYDVIVVGSGNAALCAGIAALDQGASVLMIEKADKEEMGGNSRYTAGAMRFVYHSNEDLIPLLLNPNDERLASTDFGTYPKAKFQQDLSDFNDGRPLSMHQHLLIDESYETVRWMSTHNIRFEPIYSRQSFMKNGKYTFWGGLTLAAKGEGEGLVEAELNEYLRLGGEIIYACEVEHLIFEDGKVKGVNCSLENRKQQFRSHSTVLGCGGFEANPELRKKYLGEKWGKSKVRGTRHNMGKGIEMAMSIGAVLYGTRDGCHATPMDKNMPEYGNLEIPHIERKHYRKICYFLGVMLNANGKRFVDEGKNFRNYTYAQFGKDILNQPGSIAWQIFDNKVEELLYSEYRFWDASFVQGDTLEQLIGKLEGIDKAQALKTLQEYNAAVDQQADFDPTRLDRKSTKELAINKTNWANILDTPPFKAYPVTCGITFTYGGLKVDENAAILNGHNTPIPGLFACGELVGGVFHHGYPGGSGLTSGAVFGRLAGYSATHTSLL